MRRTSSTLAFLWIVFLAPLSAQAVRITTVPVGKGGRRRGYDWLFGAVVYNYRIGTTEVINTQ